MLSPLLLPLFLLARLAAASPQQLAGVPSTAEERKMAPTRQSWLAKPSLAAVPLPVPAAAHPSLGVSAVVTQCTNIVGEVAGNGSWFIPWWAAAAGGAWQGTRGRPRRRRRAAARAAGAQVVLEAPAEDEAVEEPPAQPQPTLQPAGVTVFAVPATAPAAFAGNVAGTPAVACWVPSANWPQQSQQQQLQQQQQQQHQQIDAWPPQLPQQQPQQQQQLQLLQLQPQSLQQPVEQAVQLVPCWTGPWAPVAAVAAASGPSGLQQEVLQQAAPERPSHAGPLRPGLAIWPTAEALRSLAPHSVAAEAVMSPQLTLVPQTPSSSRSVEQESSCPSPRSSQDANARPRWTAKEAEQAVALLRGDDVVQRRALLDRLAPAAWPAALSKHGCHVLQAALEVADSGRRVALAEAFKGHVWEALRSPHANHVLQKCIELLPPKRMEFVLAELAGRARETARHRFGCRVLERLLEHDCWRTSGLVDEVLRDVLDLSTHPYGNFVVQHILEHGTEVQRSLVVEALRPEARRLARHKNASHVVERALQYGSQDARQALKEAIIGDAEELMRLSHSNYGSFVAKAMRKR